MTEPLLACGAALWLGVLTSISPCPLATNIAAVSFVSRRLGTRWAVIAGGALYTLGRLLAYTLVGALLAYGLLAAPGVSRFLQGRMPMILGPLLIVTGMFLLKLLSLNLPSLPISPRMQARLGSVGLWGEAGLGFIFALAFCPVSAALFFGSLIPLAVENGSPWLMPALYGIGTALPVLVISMLLAWSARWVGRGLDLLRHFEAWATPITGTILVGIGIYLSLKNIFGLV